MRKTGARGHRSVHRRKIDHAAFHPGRNAEALKLEEALRAPDASRMWPLVMSDLLEDVETELRRGEYPPFDRWYQESWIRSALSFNNPHRAYNQVRAFIGNEGHGKLVRMGQR